MLSPPLSPGQAEGEAGPGAANRRCTIGRDMFIALTRAFISLLHRRMLFLMVWPALVALVLWLVLVVAFWTQAVQWIDLQLNSSETIQWMITIWPLAFFAAHLAWVVLVIAFIPLVLVTTVLIISIFAMPAMVAHVASRDYPALARRRGGTFAGSVWNSFVSLVVFLLLAAITLPLWLLPFLWPVIPVLLFAYLNQRVFRYDALAEHAESGELAELIRRCRGEMFLLGVAVALVSHIPIVGFFAPVYGGLAFVHFCLERLEALRGEPIEGSAVRV